MAQNHTDSEKERYENGRKEFLEKILNPVEFQKNNAKSYCDYLQKEKVKKYFDYWINELKCDTETMDRIIETYMDVEFRDCFVLEKSIEIIEGCDSQYFEGLYNRLCVMEDSQEFNGGNDRDIAKEIYGTQDPHAKFKMQTSRNWRAKAASIRKITDEAYLKRVVEEVPDDCNFGYTTPHAIAAGRITDQSFLELVLKTKTDLLIVEAAINGLTNEELLEKYARMPDRECDQYFTENSGRLYDPDVMWKTEEGKKAYDVVFHNGHFRDAARRRLVELRGN